MLRADHAVGASAVGGVVPEAMGRGGGEVSEYSVRPWTVKRAKAFISSVHRRLGDRQPPSYLWALRLERDGVVVGCAVCGKLARGFEGRDILTISRVAVCEGTDCGCSRLYGACARTGRAMGARGMVTYTHSDESGVSLVAAGWIRDDLRAADCDWGRDGRQRELPIDGVAKVRWWAPWSERLRLVPQNT